MQKRSVIVRTTSWIARVVVMMIVIILPLGHFIISYEFVVGSLETDAEISANVVSQLLKRNPETWTYENSRLTELLSKRSGKDADVERRILDTRNRTVAESPKVLKPPVIMRSFDITDSGTIVGRIEIYRSIQPILIGTGIAALIGLALGSLIYFALLILPLRAIRQAEEILRMSEEKYRSLVEATADTIFLIDKDYRYLFMNRNYLKRAGLSEGEYQGRGYGEFHSPEETGVFIKKVDDVFRSGEPIRYEHWSERDGRCFLRTLSPVKEPDGGITAVNVISKDVTDLKRMEDELRSLSFTDELTGLYNRRGCFALAEHLLRLADRSKVGMFMLYADVDDLKAINDVFGHQEGDAALVETGNILRDTFRNSDIIARIGGDEFVVIPIGRAGDNVEVNISRLKENLESYNSITDRKYRLSLSLGTAYYDPERPCSIDELFGRADKLMYEQKKNKRKVQLRKS